MSTPPPYDPQLARARFREAYGRHRESEGRALSAAELHELPYLRHGPLARQWRVRARSYEALLNSVVRPMARAAGRPLDVLDVGAGNGWLSHRLALHGHRAVALELREDDVDGLGAARGYLDDDGPGFVRVCGSFDDMPLADRSFDLVVFNASVHYALDLARVIGQAARATRPGGRLVILDSPFYRRERDGAAMVAEKRRQGRDRFGERADALLGLPFVEFLTRARLKAASRSPRVRWRRHRVRYPLWYEARPLLARLARQRRPSRFDLWEGRLA